MKTPMSLIAVLSFAATAAGHAPAYMQMGSSFYSLDPASGKAAKVAVTVPPAEDLTWIEATRELWARRGEDIGIVDPTDGSFTPKLSLPPAQLFGPGAWQSLTWHAGEQCFFSTHSGTVLCRVDMAGSTTVDGSLTHDIVALDTDDIGNLIGIDSASNTVLINKTTAVGMTLASLPVTGSFSSWRTLTYDSSTGHWLGMHAEPGPKTIYRLDPWTGSVNALVTTNASELPTGFALTPRPGAYIIDTNSVALRGVDLDTGASELIASIQNNGLQDPADLTWNSDTHQLWTVDASGGEVGTVSTQTGQFTKVFDTHLNSWDAIAWDRESNRFYLHRGDGLYSLTLSGALSFIADPLPTQHMSSLDVDAAGQLFAISPYTNKAYMMDKETGAVTTFSVGQTHLAEGMTIDMATGAFYARAELDDSLYLLNPYTGTSTLIGSFGAAPAFSRGFEVADLPPTGSIARFGQGCTDSGGTVNTLIFGGAPAIGENVFIGAATSPGLQFQLAVGLSNSSWNGVPLPFTYQAGCSILVSLNLMLGPFLSGSMVPVALPEDPILVGATIYWQALAADGGLTPHPFASSDGIAMTIGDA